MQDGRTGYFELLVKRYRGMVERTITGMIGYCDDVEDIAQEVFISFFRKLKNFRREAKVSTFLTRIAVHLSLNFIKKRKREQKRFAETSQEDFIQTITDGKDETALLEDSELLHNALTKVTPQYREVIVLRLINCYSTEETAGIIGKPIGTVASRLHRGLDELKKIILPSYREES